MKPITLAACITLASTAFSQATINYGPVLDVNASGQGHLRPRIAINGDDMPVVIWGRSNPNANFVAVGTGTSFAPGTTVHLPGVLLPAVADWQGSSIAAAGNTVWVVMKMTPEDSEAIYVRRSDDGGYTWGDTIRVEPFDGMISRFPVIDVIDADSPIVQYMQFNDGFMGARYVVTRMENGMFQEPVQVSTPFAPGNVCDCCPAQIVTEGERVAALFRNAGNDERVMWGAFSEDQAETFPYGSKLDTTGWIISQCMSSGPDGFMTGDSITYAFMSGATQGSKVYVGRAHMIDGGIGHHSRISGASQSVIQNYPRIAGVGDTIGVVWEQQSGSAMEILFRWSTTGPGGFGDIDTVNIDLSGMQMTPDIAYADGAFHIVWGEMGPGQVRYRKAVLENTVAMVEGTEHNVIAFWPNPTDRTLFTNAPDNSNYTFTDRTGRIVKHGTVMNGRIDLSGLTAGAYFITAIDPQGGSMVEKVEKR
jgi:hypothetical protein